MEKISAVVRLMRVHQWVKNLFIFLPMFFSMKIGQLDLLLHATYAFIGYSFIASAVYVFNDWLDVEEDRLHPTKRNRPIASGQVGKSEALVLIAVLLGIGLFTFYLCHAANTIWICVLVYIVQNILYTLWLKHVPIIDISIIAIGFVLRIIVGGIATNTALTHWIILMTFLLALFLALAKRRDDVLIFTQTGKVVRKNIHGYNVDLLNSLMTIMSAIVIVAYIMYTTTPEVMGRVGQNTYMTSFFVILGIMRYLQITFVQEKSGNPTKILLKDVFLQAVILLWVAAFALILFLHL
jgi:decaprenyl-phosphate phosphoribosyltransferase